MSTREPEQPSAAAPPAAPPVAPAPVQHELPLAIVNGQPLTELPQDLYIPPQALEVFLDAFEGPLDLLLYLIRRQNLDILDIPVAQITHQYMGYVELMKAVRLELAAEYLVMAAMLAEIKSRMLLPRQETQGDEEEDPRAELIRRLQEYERFRQAAEQLDELPRGGRDIALASAAPPALQARTAHPPVSMEELLLSLAEVLRRADMFESHQISRETLSTRERMTQVPVRALQRPLHSRGGAARSGGDLHGGARADQGTTGRSGAERALCTHSRQGKDRCHSQRLNGFSRRCCRRRASR